MAAITFTSDLSSCLSTLTGKNSWNLDMTTYQNLPITSLMESKEFQKNVLAQLGQLQPILQTGNELIYQAALKNLHEAGIFLSFILIMEAKTKALHDKKEKGPELGDSLDILDTFDDQDKFQGLFRSSQNPNSNVENQKTHIFTKLLSTKFKDSNYQLACLYLLISSGLTIVNESNSEIPQAWAEALKVANPYISYIPLCTPSPLPIEEAISLKETVWSDLSILALIFSVFIALFYIILFQ